jgi:hypothetical protein
VGVAPPPDRFHTLPQRRLGTLAVMLSKRALVLASAGVYLLLLEAALMVALLPGRPSGPRPASSQARPCRRIGRGLIAPRQNGG